MTDDSLVLIAGLHKQNEAILLELRALQEKIEQLQKNAPDPLNAWVIGYANLREALLNAGMKVGVVRLRTLRNCGVLREGQECRDIGTGSVPRYRFNVAKCKEAIARFESLPVVEQRRILGQ